MAVNGDHEGGAGKQAAARVQTIAALALGAVTAVCAASTTPRLTLFAGVSEAGHVTIGALQQALGT